ncbi:hypothetical protein FRZ67_22860 [Panacibacter ginsenosidivorans]|uniref:Uncharacterized protein n=1 Tax=Panacibacter ginsenosidivorans TaxID=1813871 RepID=A0A5B8VF05_9BACT|nr:hypothetical protein [Panacibacter ginsenosidivorans]QEC70000.1 hypothetical protein FRZ67_22860 [Panacibacter ginsenosidivorans]
MKQLYIISLLFITSAVRSQQVDSIAFHLYTDSLKKGTFNYINVDGKLSNGHYIPLTDKQIKFESNAGHWEGNSLIIDSGYTKDSVIITATLKERPQLFKIITVYIKKSSYEGKVYTEKELSEKDNKKKKKNQ